MGDNPDLTLVILGKIHDEIRATRESLTARIDATNERLETTNERLDLVVREQIRQSTAIIELQRGQGAIVDAIVALDHRQDAVEQGLGQVVEQLKQLNGRVDWVLTGPMGDAVRKHGTRLDALESRVQGLERKAG